MTKNKEYRKQLQGQYRALEEHLQKIAEEKQKPIESQDLGLIAHWEKTVANCRQQIAKLQRRLNQ
jgi:uncharacterized membrane protein YccC